MNNHKYLLFSVLLLLLSSVTFSLVADTKTLTLEDCLKLGEKNNFG